MFVACQPSPEPRSILDKAILAHGGEEKIMKPRAGIIRTKESRGTKGDETTIEEMFDLPKRWKRVVTTLEKGQRTTINLLVVDGEVWTWEVGRDVLKTKDDGRIYPTFRKGSALIGLKSEKVKLSPIKKVSVDGQLASGFRASWDGGTADYYFDDKSGLLVQSMYKVMPKPGEELQAKVVLSNYKEIDGVQVAHRSTTYLKGGQLEDFTLITEFTLTEVIILDKLPDDAITLPKKN